MAKTRKIFWKEISRRGSAQPILVLDALLLLYQAGEMGKAHGVKWNPTEYRQFDRPRWFSQKSWDGYISMLKRGEERHHGFLLRNAREFDKRITLHRKFASQYKNIDFNKLDNQALVKLFLAWFKITRGFWCFAYDYIFINKFLPEQVISIIEAKVPDHLRQNEILGVLFTADQYSEMWHEKRSLYNLAGKVKSRRLKVKSLLFNRYIKLHLKYFAHLGFYYFRGEAFTAQTVEQRLREYLNLTRSQLALVGQDLVKQEKNDYLTNRVIKQLKLDRATVEKIRIIKRWGALSNYVDETYGYAVHQLQGMWRTIRERIGGLTLRDMASFRAQEIVDMLLGKRSIKKSKEEAKQRLQEHVFLFEGGKISLLVGQEARAYRHREKSKKISYVKVNKLNGQPASPRHRPGGLYYARPKEGGTGQYHGHGCNQPNLRPSYGAGRGNCYR